MTARHKAIDLVIEVPAVVVTFLMMLHVTANALLRTFWNNPIDYTLEYVQYIYMPLIAFLGFAAAQRRGQHVAADLIYERLPVLTRKYVLAVVLAVSAVLSAGFAWFGLQEALHAAEIEKTAGVSDVPAWPAYFLVPLAFTSLTFQFGYAAVKALRGADDSAVVTGVDPAEAELDQALEPQRSDARA